MTGCRESTVQELLEHSTFPGTSLVGPAEAHVPAALRLHQASRVETVASSPPVYLHLPSVTLPFEGSG